MRGGSSIARRASGVCVAGAKRTFSSGRRLAYFQFSSREPGRPCVSSACTALRLRCRLMRLAGSELAVLACSWEMRVAKAELMSISRRLAGDPVVAAFLQLQSQAPVAAAGNSAAHQNMHEVGNDVLEQPLVVRHEEERALRRAQLVHPVRHDLQGIDVEAGVGLVQHGEPGLQHQHLQDLVALFLAAGEASFTPRDRKLSSMCMSFIFSRTSPRNSKASTSGRPRSLRAALVAAFSRYTLLTPGISTGYWNPRNTPARARSSGAMASRSRPSKLTRPEVIS